MENKIKTSGSSVVIQQFVALARGEVEPHAPRNEFRTVEVSTEVLFCLNCFTNGNWDVWEGVHDGMSFRIGRCRNCGNEVTL